MQVCSPSIFSIMKQNMKRIALLLCLAGAAQTLNGQDGSLDLTFSSDGLVTTSIGGFQDQGNAVAVQPDGKIVQAGYAYNGSNFDFALIRYHSDATLDNSFDVDGVVTADFGGFSNEGRAVAIQADGKIIIAGNTFNGFNQDFALVRYNSDGSIDNTFGAFGKVKTDVSGSNDFIYSIVIQSDQKIVVGGTTYNGSNEDFTVVRYNADGTLDTDFSGDGIASADFASSIDTGISLQLQADGKLVLAGWTGDFPYVDFAAVRFDSYGSLDNSFDSDGKVTVDIQSSYDQGAALAIQDDGKLVIGGTTNLGPQSNFAIARLNADGSLDTDFNTTGTLLIDAGPNGFDMGNTVAMQSDGKILFGGYSSDGSSGDFALVRLLENGTLDPTFDSDGKVATDFGGNDDQAYAMVVQSDDYILLGGMSNFEFALARYEVTICNLTAAATLTGFQLNASESGASYQWIDCANSNAPIAGEINQSYNPVSDGEYAVIVEKNGCIDTSDCVTVQGLFMPESRQSFFSIGPNPTNGLTQVNFDLDRGKLVLRVISMEGNRVAEYVFEKDANNLMDLSNLPKGVYLVQAEQAEAREQIKLVLH